MADHLHVFRNNGLKVGLKLQVDYHTGHVRGMLQRYHTAKLKRHKYIGLQNSGR